MEEYGPYPRFWSNPTTSLGSACRRSAFLEKTTFPSTVTSNTPPDD